MHGQLRGTLSTDIQSEHSDPEQTPLCEGPCFAFSALHSAKPKILCKPE